VTKAFLSSLSVEHLRTVPALRKLNFRPVGSHPVLILVTGKWAKSISMADYFRNRGRLDKIPPEEYDHLERLGAGAHPAECSEVTKAYRVLEYHCSMCVYEAGTEHAWQLAGVSPMLSELVLLPRLLHERRVEDVMRKFDWALKKMLRDSVIVAGGRLYKEETFRQKEISTEGNEAKPV
jgi:hypothetical protein